MQIKNLVGDLNPYANRKIQGREKADQVARSAQDSSRSGDSVSLSSEARLQSAAFATASSSPDTRAEKVRDLKEQVRNGTYQPDIRKAAQNLLRDEAQLLSGS